MPQGKGTYGNKIGRPSKKNKEFMLTYGNPGDNVKVIYKDSLEELQKKAQELRRKNFIIDKMGRTQPLSELRKKIEGKQKFKFNKISQSYDLIGKPKTQAKKSESKQEFNKISQSFDLIGKPTKLTRPGYAGGGKSKRR